MDQILEAKLETLPAAPGVYLMKDRAGRIVYVGKAVNLRSRVRSYFNRAGDGRAFVPLLEGLLGDVETILTGSEKEALILENTLIKKHRPRFNVMLRDDKSFISLKLDKTVPYPRLEIVRRRAPGTERDGGVVYFGPYSSARSIRETLRVVNRHFQLRSCSDRELGDRSRPCPEWHLGRAPKPCWLDVPEADYARSVREAELFLSGRGDELVLHLRNRMREAAGAERFEEAARLRDQLQAVEHSLERQRMVQQERVDQDVFGFVRRGPRLCVAVLLVRRGRLQDSQAFDFVQQEFPTEELLASFIALYYDAAAAVPRELLLPLPLEDEAALAEWLSEKAGRAVRVLVPQRGEKRRLVEMAGANAEQAFREREDQGRDLEETLGRLQRALSLRKVPRTLECYDISNFQGTEVVGSKVAFRDGKPFKDGYRRFRVKGLAGQDDFASIYQVMRRRLAQGQRDGDLPDLLIIDGGKGQLNAAEAALRDAGAGDVDLISLAKSRVLDGAGAGGAARRSAERVFLPGVKDPVVLKQNTSELFLLQRLRDEAHRFAIGYHRKLRDRRTLRSALDAVPGIGPARRRALLRQFGSVKGVREADVPALTAVPGINAELAERILATLRTSNL
ncbi:MAG: excinuclease ABC subunit UvrC [Myxococcales bacterium]